VLTSWRRAEMKQAPNDQPSCVKGTAANPLVLLRASCPGESLLKTEAGSGGLQGLAPSHTWASHIGLSPDRPRQHGFGGRLDEHGAQLLFSLAPMGEGFIADRA
jgi:hypothetical protein